MFFIYAKGFFFVLLWLFCYVCAERQSSEAQYWSNQIDLRDVLLNLGWRCWEWRVIWGLRIRSIKRSIKDQRRHQVACLENEGKEAEKELKNIKIAVMLWCCEFESQPHTALLLMRRTIVLYFAVSLPELATNELEIYINKHELTFNAKINNILFDCVSLKLTS